MSNKKILIVEDEIALSRALTLKLNHAGYETDVVEDGNDAIAILKKSKYDLILLDLIIPYMDGFSILEKLKEMKVTTPVIVLSNLSQVEDIDKTKELGVAGYFIKSNTPLFELVNNIIKFLEEDATK